MDYKKEISMYQMELEKKQHEIIKAQKAQKEKKEVEDKLNAAKEIIKGYSKLI